MRAYFDFRITRKSYFQTFKCRSLSSFIGVILRFCAKGQKKTNLEGFSLDKKTFLIDEAVNLAVIFSQTRAYLRRKDKHPTDRYASLQLHSNIDSVAAFLFVFSPVACMLLTTVTTYLNLCSLLVWLTFGGSCMTQTNYLYHLQTISISSYNGYKLNALLTYYERGFIAQSVEHRNGIAEVMGSNPVGPSEFFLAFICNCLSYTHPSRMKRSNKSSQEKVRPGIQLMSKVQSGVNLWS